MDILKNKRDLKEENKIELNNSNNLTSMQEIMSEKSCNKKIVTDNINVSNDTTNISSDKVTMKNLKMDKIQNHPKTPQHTWVLRQ